MHAPEVATATSLKERPEPENALLTTTESRQASGSRQWALPGGSAPRAEGSPVFVEAVPAAPPLLPSSAASCTGAAAGPPRSTAPLSLQGLNSDILQALEQHFPRKVSKTQPMGFLASGVDVASFTGDEFPYSGTADVQAHQGAKYDAAHMHSAGGARQQCAFFLRNGTCAFGDRCKFEHPVDRAPIVQYNILGLPLRPGQPNCSYYCRNLRCSFGHLCKYNHPDPLLPGLQALSASASPGLQGGPMAAMMVQQAPPMAVPYGFAFASP